MPRVIESAKAFLIPDELWEKIEATLPDRKNTHRFGGGRPRANDRSCMDAIFFVLRTGCQWQALNATGLCPSSTAHDRFQEWAQAGVFHKLWRLGLRRYNQMVGIDWESLCMDGCMNKAPLGGDKTGRNPTDRGKGGTKRSMRVDGAGVPLSIVVAGANTHDSQLNGQTLEAIATPRPMPTAEHPQHLYRDKGYDYDEVRELDKTFGFTTHIKSRGQEAREIVKWAGKRAKRWIIERTQSWMNRFRRILVRWEKKPRNYLGFLHLVCAIITWRHAGLFG